MISVFDFLDYRAFLNSWIDEQSKVTKGLKGKLAQTSGVSSSLISLILKGEKHLSLEQAAEISDFIGLNEKESEYFFLIVELGRAGTVKLQQKLKKRAQEQTKKISKRLVQNMEINDEVKSVYYSSWIYSGLRNLTALPGKHDVPSLAKRLRLPATVIAKATEFLVQNGLCRIEKNGIAYGSQRSHLDADSPFVVKHHHNWRNRAMHFMDQGDPAHLFFSSPMSLSEETAEEIRRLLPKFIEQVMAKVGPSKSEKVYCLNIDWFEY
jgi:uncharacterized protein (TIGR02147 family)